MVSIPVAGLSASVLGYVQAQKNYLEEENRKREMCLKLSINNPDVQLGTKH